MKKRNPYKTAQQEAMLQYFLEDKHNFLTVKDLLSSLQKSPRSISTLKIPLLLSVRTNFRLPKATRSLRN